MLSIDLLNVSTVDLIELALVCISVFAAVYFNNRRMREQNEKRLDEKADINYVDKQDQLLKVDIEKKADKSLVESMDKKLDLILNKLR